MRKSVRFDLQAGPLTDSDQQRGGRGASTWRSRRRHSGLAAPADLTQHGAKRQGPPCRPASPFASILTSSRRLGPGKIALLESIGETGSISAAGRAHAMSYRKAWLLVEEMNRMFARPLVAARPGGVDGGGAELTEAGRQVAALYRAAERKMRAGAKAEIARMERALAEIG